jgi:hypothetical protein
MFPTRFAKLPAALVFVICTCASADGLSSEPPRRGLRAASPSPGAAGRFAGSLAPRLTELPDTRLPGGLRPPDAAAAVFGPEQRSAPAAGERPWKPVLTCWTAANLWHRPLYFEEAMLERHGQSHCPLVQPALSGARFFLTFPALPYAMTVDPPCRPVSTLGSFRPGTSAPLLCQRPPLQVDAGLVEAGVLIGLIFLIP